MRILNFYSLMVASFCLVPLASCRGDQNTEASVDGKKAEKLKLLLENTIIKDVSLPEQTMEARVDAIERFARGAGIDKSRLRFTWTGRRADEVKQFKRPELKKDSISLYEILVYSMASTSMRISMEAEGEILIFHGAEKWPEK